MKLPDSPAFKSSLPDLLAWRGADARHGGEGSPRHEARSPASQLLPDVKEREDGAVGRGSVMVVVVEGECCDGGWRQWLRRWIWWGEMTESKEAAGEEKQRGGGAEKKTVNSVCGQSFALTFLLTLV
ncbi:hypothetical protein Droror1_Dr00028336 [Drosera rotundifolia]